MRVIMREGTWIGVDLDGTLAHYDKWRGKDHIGEPIHSMITRIRIWIHRGYIVKIFTARHGNGEKQISIIQDWLEKVGLPRLEVTATKDYKMVELWDDRAVQVVPNTGLRVDSEEKHQKLYHDSVEAQKPIIEKSPQQKMDELSKMMLMMRSDLIGTIESLRKHPQLSVHLIPNKAKAYNIGVNDSVKAIHYYYQGIFAKAVEGIPNGGKTSETETSSKDSAPDKT